MTRISIVCLLTSSLAALALSASGAGAFQVVTPKIHVPKVTINAPKPKVGEITIQKQTETSSPDLFKKTVNVDSSPLRKIVDSPTKSKTGNPKVKGVVVQKKIDPDSPVLFRRSLIDPGHQ